ncbi:phage DNA packaging [Trabulsiella guamensis ATCC 49490]|uniref:Phage DNA packaging n=1 Tax=Trabulsiella guamensis ATCC 49490 TaxID=1005994 RepID=A0A085AFQ0_9ENTR|nr:terminase small subunit [Trabulsiella guamensis]KFC09045.1 phage DNA packaging [Trabulsiella guamensis ATCC 49490]
MAVLLNKSDMAASIGISVQAFDKWGVIPVERKGREVFYDVKTVIEKDRERRQRKQQPDDDENDDLETQLLKERISLTAEQARSQRLKNQVKEGELIDTGFCSFALSKLAMDLSSILDAIPLSMQRQFPELSPQQVEHLKRLVAKGANACARAGDQLQAMMDEYISDTDE